MAGVGRPLQRPHCNTAQPSSKHQQVVGLAMCKWQLHLSRLTRTPCMPLTPSSNHSRDPSGSCSHNILSHSPLILTCSLSTSQRPHMHQSVRQVSSSSLLHPGSQLMQLAFPHCHPKCPPQPPCSAPMPHNPSPPMPIQTPPTLPCSNPLALHCLGPRHLAQCSSSCSSISKCWVSTMEGKPAHGLRRLDCNKQVDLSLLSSNSSSRWWGRAWLLRRPML